MGSNVERSRADLQIVTNQATKGLEQAKTAKSHLQKSAEALKSTIIKGSGSEIKEATVGNYTSAQKEVYDSYKTKQSKLLHSEREEVEKPLLARDREITKGEALKTKAEQKLSERNKSLGVFKKSEGKRIKESSKEITSLSTISRELSTQNMLISKKITDLNAKAERLHEAAHHTINSLSAINDQKNEIDKAISTLTKAAESVDKKSAKDLGVEITQLKEQRSLLIKLENDIKSRGFDEIDSEAQYKNLMNTFDNIWMGDNEKGSEGTFAQIKKNVGYRISYANDILGSAKKKNPGLFSGVFHKLSDTFGGGSKIERRHSAPPSYTVSVKDVPIPRSRSASSPVKPEQPAYLDGFSPKPAASEKVAVPPRRDLNQAAQSEQKVAVPPRPRNLPGASQTQPGRTRLGPQEPATAQTQAGKPAAPKQEIQQEEVKAPPRPEFNRAAQTQPGRTRLGPEEPASAQTQASKAAAPKQETQQEEVKAPPRPEFNQAAQTQPGRASPRQAQAPRFTPGQTQPGQVKQTQARRPGISPNLVQPPPLTTPPPIAAKTTTDMPKRFSLNPETAVDTKAVLTNVGDLREAMLFKSKTVNDNEALAILNSALKSANSKKFKEAKTSPEAMNELHDLYIALNNIGARGDTPLAKLKDSKSAQKFLKNMEKEFPQVKLQGNFHLRVLADSKMQVENWARTNTAIDLQKKIISEDLPIYRQNISEAKKSYEAANVRGMPEGRLKQGLMEELALMEKLTRPGLTSEDELKISQEWRIKNELPANLIQGMVTAFNAAFGKDKLVEEGADASKLKGALGSLKQSDPNNAESYEELAQYVTDVEQAVNYAHEKLYVKSGKDWVLRTDITTEQKDSVIKEIQKRRNDCIDKYDKLKLPSSAITAIQFNQLVGSLNTIIDTTILNQIK